MIELIGVSPQFLPPDAFGNALGSSLAGGSFNEASQNEDRLGQFIEQNQASWSQRQANYDQIVTAFGGQAGPDRSNDVQVADAKFGRRGVYEAGSYVDAAGNRVQVLTDSPSQPSIDALLKQAQGLANDLAGPAGGSPRSQSGNASWRAREAQATTNLYGSGAGDVRETTPAFIPTLPEITVIAPRMSQAEMDAFDRLSPGSDSISPIGELDGVLTFKPAGQALRGAGNFAYNAWMTGPRAAIGLGNLAQDAVGYAANAISPNRSVLTGEAFAYQPRSSLMQSVQQQGVLGTLGTGITGAVRNAPKNRVRSFITIKSQAGNWGLALQPSRWHRKN